jgi:hypothetical protein
MTPTVRAAWMLAIALWLVPIVVLQVVRAKRDRELWAVALDVPLAVALDLLSILVMARFVRLETAALVSRPAWVLGGGAMVAWRTLRHDPPRWPRCLRASLLLAGATSGALAVLSASGISYRFVVWDLDWHIPLVTAIAAQKLPFVNALSPKEVLHYHFSGDVLAVLIRALSFDVVSAPRALHTGHDLMFFAMACTLAWLAVAQGLRPWWSAILGGVAIVLQGPIPLRGALGHPFSGYMYHDFMNLSYRPHVPIAGLMLIGAFGTLAVRTRLPGIVRTRATAPTLVAVISLLAVTDEASTGLVGLTLGVAWLVDYRVIAESRLTGLFLLLVLSIAFIGINLLFDGSLARGGPVQTVTAAAQPRVQDIWAGSSEPLSRHDGKAILFFDMLPMVSCGVALLLLAWGLASRAHAAIAVSVLALITLSAVLATHLDINHDGSEVQRFFVAPFFACIVLAVLHLGQMTRGSLASVLVLLGAGVPACYTVFWIRELSTSAMASYEDGKWPRPEPYRLFDLDCRATAGAHFGDHAEPTYIESADFYGVLSCRPSYSFGNYFGAWRVRITPTIESLPQLRALNDNLVEVGDELDAICRKDGPSDSVCARAKREPSACRAVGDRFVHCKLSPADRDALLSRRPAPTL